MILMYWYNSLRKSVNYIVSNDFNKIMKKRKLR